VTTSWDERAQAYRDSPGHRAGNDLDLLVAWAAPAAGVEALDVATGGGHVARRLREAGARVTTCDASPGMQPDVVCPAEELPFADGSFDVVACRIAAHHFSDVAAAVGELARVARDRVVVEDTLFVSEEVERAERLRDATHVRSHSEAEWRGFFADAGLEVEQTALEEKRQPLSAWLARTGCEGEDAAEVRRLLADRTEGDEWVDTKLLLLGRKR
jgi:SAM-dependent methyltransferase